MKNPLNDKDVNGNTFAWMVDSLRDTGESHQDQYICQCCKTIVPEREWVAKAKCCTDCFMDNN